MKTEREDMMELNDLYRDVILDHNRRPRNFGVLESADARVEGFNPLCGDRLTVQLEDGGRCDRGHSLRRPGLRDIDRLGFADDRSRQGQEPHRRAGLFDRIHSLLTDDAAPSDELGKLAALSGVREFPARVKCASLCWHTLAAALKAPDPQHLTAVSTETD